MSELKTVIEGLGESWAQFRDQYDKRLDALERRNVDARRLLVGGAIQSGNRDAALADERKALATFARSGDGRELKAFSIGTPADGGYTVPKEISNELLRVAKISTPMRQLARVYQSESSDFRIPISTGGTGAAWSAEGGTRSASNTPTLAEIVPPGGELYANATISNWLLDDSQFDIGQWLVDEIGQQFGVTENNAFTAGDGTNKPKGLTTYTTAATADSGRAFGTIEHLATGVSADFAATNKGDKLIELTYKLKAAYRPGAVWQMPAAVAAEIRQFKDSQGRYLWAESLQPGAPPMLAGFPVYENEDMPAKAANALSIAFGNFAAAYAIVDRVQMTLIRDNVTTKGQTLFYVAKRTYGGVVDSNALKFLKF